MQLDARVAAHARARRVARPVDARALTCTCICAVVVFGALVLTLTCVVVVVVVGGGVVGVVVGVHDGGAEDAREAREVAVEVRVAVAQHARLERPVARLEPVLLRPAWGCSPRGKRVSMV